jgi:hypothetical protein
MAILFDDAIPEYLSATPPVTAAPFTMSCWFYSDSATVRQPLIGFRDASDGSRVINLEAGGSVGGDPVTLFRRAGSAESLNTTTGYTVSTWHHACASLAASTDASVYIDGGSKSTSTATFAPAGIDTFEIGEGNEAAAMSGRIAEVAIWNVALNDAEVAALAFGNSPLLIRFSSLVFYLPMFGLGTNNTLHDWISNRVVTEVNTPVGAAHAPVITEYIDG